MTAPRPRPSEARPFEDRLVGCQVCGTLLEQAPTRGRPRIYCSPECVRIGRNRIRRANYANDRPR